MSFKTYFLNFAQFSVVFPKLLTATLALKASVIGLGAIQLWPDIALSLHHIPSKRTSSTLAAVWQPLS